MFQGPAAIDPAAAEQDAYDSLPTCKYCSDVITEHADGELEHFCTDCRELITDSRDQLKTLEQHLTEYKADVTSHGTNAAIDFDALKLAAEGVIDTVEEIEHLTAEIAKRTTA
jgi:hypothetical protein